MERRISAGSILVGIYLLSVPLFSHSREMGLSIFPRIIGGVVLAYTLFYLLHIGRIKRNSTIGIYFLFTIWCIIPYIFSGYPMNYEGMVSTIQVGLITICAAILINSEKDFIVTLLVFFSSVFFVVWLNLESLMSFGTVELGTEADRFSGTLQNPNTTALYAIAIIWSGVMLLILIKQLLLLRFIIVFGLMSAIFLVIASGSRKGLIGLGIISIAIANYLIIRYGRSKTRKFVLVFLVGLGVAALFYLVMGSPFFYRLELMFLGEPSSIYRAYLFEEAIKVWNSSVKNLVIGVGIGNFERFNYLYTYSHSTISEALVCTGVIGFVLYFASIFAVIKVFYKGYEYNVDKSKGFFQLFLVFLLVVLFFNIFAVMFSSRMFWPLIGIISSYGLLLKRNSSVLE